MLTSTYQQQLEEAEAQLFARIAAMLEEQRALQLPSCERPAIGILVPEESTAGEKDTIAAIAEAGGAPLLLPTYPIIAGLDLFDILTDERAFRFIFDTIWPVVRDLDGLVFTGGGDLDSRFFYRKIPHPQLQSADPWRDTWEWFAALLCWMTYRTTLGIGRGAQLMNVALRGGLFQDQKELRAFRKNGMPPLEVHQRGRPSSKNPIDHPLLIIPDSWLAQAVRGRAEHACLKYSLDAVSSMHHNFIGLLQPDSAGIIGDLAEGLVVAGYSPDRVIEAVGAKDPRRIYVAVQFHPEFARTLSWASGIFSYVVAGSTRDALVDRSLLEAFRKDILAWLWLCGRTLHDLQTPLTAELARFDGHAQEPGRRTDELSEATRGSTAHAQ
jgi:gamma-glutamyl-gamma-aminobutyrate hydrolase PuuD